MLSIVPYMRKPHHGLSHVKRVCPFRKRVPCPLVSERSSWCLHPIFSALPELPAPHSSPLPPVRDLWPFHPTLLWWSPHPKLSWMCQFECGEVSVVGKEHLVSALLGFDGTFLGCQWIAWLVHKALKDRNFKLFAWWGGSIMQNSYLCSIKAKMSTPAPSLRTVVLCQR